VIAITTTKACAKFAHDQAHAFGADAIGFRAALVAEPSSQT
jgi:hypothetical protein